MRKVVFGVASSLDNFIAGPQHQVDWLLWSDDVAAIMKEIWSTFDAIVMGRKTYDVARESGGGGGNYGLKGYVFSRTLRPEDHPDVEIISEDPGAFMKKLKRRKGKDICVMSGGELASALLEAGVIDEIGLNIHPIILGSGIPLFHAMKRRVRLDLLECRPIQHGCVYVRYVVKR